MMFGSLLFNPKWWSSYFTPDRFSYDQIPVLTGKVAIVTGANCGLGYATAVALAARGCHVFFACRNEKRALLAMERAKAEIRGEFPLVKPKMDFLHLDLNNLKKTKAAAQEFLAKNLPLHILVCNSGIMNTPFELTDDGVEQQFGVNHLGHFVFTLALLDRLKASQPARVVVVSSFMHEWTVRGGIDFDTLNDRHASINWTRYGRSKLANILFAQELARRLASEKVFVNVCNPSFVNTELNRSAEVVFGKIIGACTNIGKDIVGATPKRGALTQLYLATSPEIERQDVRGQYFMPVANECTPNSITKNMALQTKLWEFSEALMLEKLSSGSEAAHAI